MLCNISMLGLGTLLVQEFYSALPARLILHFTRTTNPAMKGQNVILEPNELRGSLSFSVLELEKHLMI